MSMPDVLDGWYPLALTRAVGPKPLIRELAGVHIRLHREPDGAVLARETPSGGNRRLIESDGWVFAEYGAAHADEFGMGPLLTEPCCRIHTEGWVGAGMGDVGENILDTTHTSVVHQGYLRRAGERRPVEAEISAGDGWISARYPPGAAPSGWGARLLGAHRYTITDTFRAPAVAEVMYSKGSDPVFAARFHLAPAARDRTYVAATISVPGHGLVAALKLAALRMFFMRIFAEDRAILELISANRAAHGHAPLIFAPQDLLRPGIEAILAGRAPLLPAPRVALRV